MKRVLLLGRNGRILDVVCWKAAINLTYFRGCGRDVVFPLEYHDVEVRSQYQSFKLPAVMILLGNRDRYPNSDVLPLSRSNVLLRDEYTCQYCGKKLSFTSGTIDHVFPLCKGGTNTWRNVVACCEDCNNEKDDLRLEQYTKQTGKKLKKKPRTPSRGVLFRSYVEKEGYGCWKPYISV